MAGNNFFCALKGLFKSSSSAQSLVGEVKQQSQGSSASLGWVELGKPLQPRLPVIALGFPGPTRAALRSLKEGSSPSQHKPAWGWGAKRAEATPQHSQRGAQSFLASEVSG